VSADIAVVLAEMPDVIARLIAEHQPNERGLCRACGTPGTGTAYLLHPCPLRTLAEHAAALRRR
jgi:hypothetical protein